ncbi:hypothetical protein LINPERHAP1_LOCUS41170 [Linum perenne]
MNVVNALTSKKGNQICFFLAFVELGHGNLYDKGDSHSHSTHASVILRSLMRKEPFSMFPALCVIQGGSSEVVNLPVAALLLVLLLLLVTSVDFMPVARLIFGFVPPVPFLRNSVSFFEELLL